MFYYGGKKQLPAGGFQAVIPAGHLDLETCPRAGLPTFPDGHTGQGENFVDEEQTVAGVFPVSLLENLWFFVVGDTLPVILVHEGQRRYRKEESRW